MPLDRDQRRVMIVDDMPFMRTILASILFLGGYTVVAEAGDGAEAVERHRELRPDLTLMDVSMPGMGGLEAARCIAAVRNVAIIFCGAEDERDLVERAAIPGTAGFILKPFGAEQVLAALRGTRVESL